MVKHIWKILHTTFTLKYLLKQYHLIYSEQFHNFQKMTLMKAVSQTLAHGTLSNFLETQCSQRRTGEHYALPKVLLSKNTEFQGNHRKYKL